MKKYIKHSNDNILYSKGDITCYVRSFKTTINNIVCFKSFPRGGYLKRISIGKYKVLGTKKQITVKGCFITEVNYYFYIRDKFYKSEILCIERGDLVYENGFNLGGVLLFESIR